MAALDFWWMLREVCLPQSVLMTTKYMRNVPFQMEQLVNTDGTWKYESIFEYLGIPDTTPALLDMNLLWTLRARWKTMVEILNDSPSSPWVLGQVTSTVKDAEYGSNLGKIDLENGTGSTIYNVMIGKCYAKDGSLAPGYTFSGGTASPTGSLIKLPTSLQKVFSGMVLAGPVPAPGRYIYTDNIRAIHNWPILYKNYPDPVTVQIYIGDLASVADGSLIVRNSTGFKTSKTDAELAALIASNASVFSPVTAITISGGTVVIKGRTSPSVPGSPVYLDLKVPKSSMEPNGLNFILDTGSYDPAATVLGDGIRWFNMDSFVTSGNQTSGLPAEMKTEYGNTQSATITAVKSKWKSILENGWLDKPDTLSEKDARRGLNAVDLLCARYYLSGSRSHGFTLPNPSMMWRGIDGLFYFTAAGAALVDRQITKSNLLYRVQPRFWDGTPVTIESGNRLNSLCIFRLNGTMYVGAMDGLIIMDSFPLPTGVYKDTNPYHDVAPEGASADIYRKWKILPAKFSTADSYDGLTYKVDYSWEGTPVSANGRNYVARKNKQASYLVYPSPVGLHPASSYPVRFQPTVSGGIAYNGNVLFGDSMRLTAEFVLTGKTSGATVPCLVIKRTVDDGYDPSTGNAVHPHYRLDTKLFQAPNAFPWPATTFIGRLVFNKEGVTTGPPTTEYGWYDHRVERATIGNGSTPGDDFEYPPTGGYSTTSTTTAAPVAASWDCGFPIAHTYLSEYRYSNRPNNPVAGVMNEDEEYPVTPPYPWDPPGYNDVFLHHKQEFDLVPPTPETFTYTQPLIDSALVQIQDVAPNEETLGTHSETSLPSLGGMIRPNDGLIASLRPYSDSSDYIHPAPWYPLWNNRTYDTVTSPSFATPAAVIFVGETLPVYHAGGNVTLIKQANPTVGTLTRGGPSGYTYTATSPGYDLLIVIDSYNKLPVAISVVVIGSSLLYAWSPMGWGLDRTTSYNSISTPTGIGSDTRLRYLLDSLPPFLLRLSDRRSGASLNSALSSANSQYTGGTVTSTRNRYDPDSLDTGVIVLPDGTFPPRIGSGGKPTSRPSNSYYGGNTGWGYGDGFGTSGIYATLPDNTWSLSTATGWYSPPITATMKRTISLVTCSAVLNLTLSAQSLVVTLSADYPVHILVYLRYTVPLDSSSTFSGQAIFGDFCPIASEMFTKSGNVYTLDLSKTTYDIPVGYTRGLMIQVRGKDLGESYTIEMKDAVLRTVMGMGNVGPAPLPSGVDNVPPATDGPVLKP